MSKDSEKSKKLIKDTLKTLVPLVVSVAMILWLFHKVNFHKVMGIINQGVDYRYLFIMMALTCLSHVIRGYRWGYQLRAAGIPRIPVMAESVSIFGAYALNLLLPFLGEGWRCLYIARREKCKLSTVVGTDLGDRGSDGVMIFLIIVLTIFVAHPEMDKFLDKYPIGEQLTRIASDAWLWIGLVASAVTLILLDKIYRNTKFVKGVNLSILRMWQGFKVLFHMKGTGMYIILTIAIWVCYFFQTYSCFFAFPFTRELIYHSGWYGGLIPGLVVFVFGSCSMIVPSNGGLGPWNIAVMFALSLFGVKDADGAAYSIVCWSFQTVMLIACGLFSIGYIIWDDRRREIRSKK